MSLSTLLAESLRKKGLLNNDLALLLGVSKGQASKILSGRANPSFSQLRLLATICEKPIDDLVKELAEKEMSSEEYEAKRFLIGQFSSKPLSVLLAQGWLSVPDNANAIQLKKALEAFDTEPVMASPKKTRPEESFTKEQEAWVLYVRRLAKQVEPSAPFNPEQMDEVIETVTRYMHSDRGYAEVFQYLKEKGITVVAVELKGSKMDGVCTWLSKDRPVIGLTLRYDREDSVFFTLLHELYHVRQGYLETTHVDSESEHPYGADEKLEAEANAGAMERCFPAHLKAKMEEELNGKVTDATVQKFANENKLNVSVVAGQIRHQLKNYKILNRLIGKAREDVCQAIPVIDGWGYKRGIDL